ncbi:alpha-amylase family glycosyl hydrolase [Photobacterium sp. SDRW27]|uniref:alpha-amylase family glycosyl hydrolase n=1 Tax=Photobacterium obscurum TaxID=2829490 RepID=UPI0022433A29|nr:alpha-amylase family glycosyl hydrolase [Photobacterium obscurum]MCW8329452.1 alpha-amylase family glycosyl hydrolase [Photobacterium obscurum]
MAKNKYKTLNKLNILSLSIALALSGCNSDNDPVAIADNSMSPSDREEQTVSPDWQDQIIYFLMIDRFNDGNSQINDQEQNEYDPTSDKKFSGGDLQGITDQLSYIQNLGATSVWITPPVANQWWDAEQNYGGYHGYWARDFQKVDEHFGDLETYQSLANELHSRDMYLIQDIVTNHVGNFFTYDNPYDYDPSSPCDGFRLITKALAPAQELPYPLNQNQCKEDGSGAYHWTPSITDHNNPEQEKTWQLSDLDDLNTSDPVVRAYLKASYRKWIKDVGVDAFRVDTAKFVEHDFWNDFFHSEDGIMAQAKATGRNNFLTFGEVFEASTPYQTEGEEKMLTYIGENGSPEQLMAVLNFPLQTTMTRVFASGQPTDYLRYRLEQMMKLFPNPYIMPNFIDNHDMPRFLSQASEEDMQQALITMMSIPGIPVIYQGTEQTMVNSRDSMFDGGYREDGQFVDSFDTDSEMYHFIQALAKLRTENKVLTRGDLKVIASDHAGAGIFSFIRSLDDDEVLVVMNTSSAPMLLNQLDVEQNAGTVFERQIQSNWKDAPASLVTDSKGKISLELAPKSAVIYFKTTRTGDVATPSTSVTLNGNWSDATITQDTEITGIATPGVILKLVVDGNLETAQDIQVDDNGEWTAMLSIRHFAIGKQQHRFTLYHADDKAGIEDIAFTSDLSWSDTPAQVVDDAGDAQDGSGGPYGTYSLPTDPSFDKDNNQLSIEKAEIYTVGSNVRLKLTMNNVTNSWLPPNGFDHVGFSVFIGLPNESEQGLKELPKINATMPAGTWNRNAVIFGWQSSIYNSVGADAKTWGQAVSPAPSVTVDKASNAIFLDFASDALGRPDSLDGISFYITSWDLDGLSATYRPIDTEKGPWNFAGTDTSEPKIWDDIATITLSE